MRTKTGLWPALAVALLASAGARGADLGDPYGYGGEGSAPTLAASSPWTWTGIYAGGHVGYSWGRVEPADVTGAIGGGVIGINGQAGAAVFGVESDLDWTGLKGNGGRRDAELNWLGTIRGRIGYAFDRFVAYGTGGVAFGSVDLSRRSLSDSHTQFGWTLGAGMEAAITEHLSAKMEYLYVSLDSATYHLPGPAPTDVSANLIRFGVNYHF